MSSDTNFNPYKYFTQVTVNLLMDNIFTMQTHNDTLDVLTNCNQALSQNWTTGSGGVDVQSWLNGIVAAAGPDGKNVDAAAAVLHNFIGVMSKDVENGTMPISEYSTLIGSQILGMINTYYQGYLDKSLDPSLDMNSVNSFNSIISSAETNETQIGQTESKTEGSVTQQDPATQQTLANCCDQVLGQFSNVASLLQQSYG